MDAKSSDRERSVTQKTPAEAGASLDELLWGRRLETEGGHRRHLLYNLQRKTFHTRHKPLAEKCAIRSEALMPFVIIDTAGQPLRDVAGELIVLAGREEAARWTIRGERVEPYISRRHDREICTART